MNTEKYLPISTNGPLGTVNVMDPQFGAYGDGIHDDTAAIQKAIDSMGSPMRGTLYIPPGLYYISKTLVADGGFPLANGGGNSGGNTVTIQCDGALLPEAGIGDALYIFNMLYPKITVRAMGGGQWGDNLLHAENCMAPIFAVWASNYLGTVFFSDGSVPGSNAVQGLAAVNGGRIYAGDCGQAISVSNYGAFGVLDSIWDVNSNYGSSFTSMGDLTILHYENVIATELSNYGSLLFNNCYSIHLGKVAIGGLNVPYALQILNCSLDNYSTGVDIDTLFIQGNGDIPIGLWVNNSGVSIGTCNTLSCTSIAVEVDGGYLKMGRHNDNASAIPLGLGNKIANVAEQVMVDAAQYVASGDYVVLVGSDTAGQLFLSHVNGSSSSTNDSILIATASLTLYLDQVTISAGNASSNLSIPNASQILGALSRTSFPQGVTYTSQGPLASLAGTTAGSVLWRQDIDSMDTIKRFVAYTSAYENDTTTNQTITFPTAYTYTPAVATNTTGLTVSASTTTLTITAPNSTTTYSGVIEVVGM